MIFRLLAAFVLLCVAAGGEVRAEGRLRIVEQFGTVYLPLHVLRDQKLIEKHGKEAGIDIKVEWTKLSGGAAVNDALLSGAVDVGAAGAGPVIVLWERTRGNADVKIIAALGEQPNYLVTNSPNIKTLKDFTKSDKIAVPAIVVSQQSRLLQIAAEKELGDGKYNALDDLTVNLPHSRCDGGDPLRLIGDIGAEFDVFVEQVVPILRNRGLFRTEYAGKTLRDHYGLSRPANFFADGVQAIA